MDLTKKRIIVTGGAGFLGSFVVDRLKALGCKNIFVPRSRDYDLRDASAITRMLDDAKPQVIFHLAASVGGIGANQKNPGSFFYDNAIMGIQLIEQARRRGVEKTIILGTICAYPKFATVPFTEDDLWTGYPEETNAPYGLAKKMLLVQSQAYRAQYNFNSIYLLPVNLYGPRDNFDPKSSHVIPALIRKCVEANFNNSKEITVWGDGSATREFLYVDDAATAIVMAAERYDGSQPVNLGMNSEISIRDLTTKIAAATHFAGAITWDTSKPNGQPRRRVSADRAKKMFGFEATTSFDVGLKATVDWYMQNHASLKKAG